MVDVIAAAGAAGGAFARWALVFSGIPGNRGCRIGWGKAAGEPGETVLGTLRDGRHVCGSAGIGAVFAAGLWLSRSFALPAPGSAWCQKVRAIGRVARAMSAVGSAFQRFSVLSLTLVSSSVQRA